ncbi:hypothetical protein ACWEYS_13305 [Staphylococcus xylosus]
MPKTLYKLLKRKYEPNKYILIPQTKILSKPVTNFLDTAHLYADLKVNMKTGQPCQLNVIVPAGAKRHK